MNKIILPFVALTTIFTIYYLSQNSEQKELNKLQKIALEVNQKNTTWKADPDARISLLDSRMFNLIIDSEPSNFDKTPIHDIELEDLPENFDSRE